jgi:hypothetical protein
MNVAATTARIRDQIQRARDASSLDGRDAHVRAALGEVVALGAVTDCPVAALQEQLTNVPVAPDEEGPYFLNQAEQLVASLEGSGAVVARCADD